MARNALNMRELRDGAPPSQVVQTTQPEYSFHGYRARRQPPQQGGKAMRRVVFVAVSYVGAVVGAGFGSGREVLQFFASYGQGGLWGAVWAGALFALVGAVLLRRVVALGPDTDYSFALRDICGRRLGRAMDLVVLPFLLIALSVVLAGGAALLAAFGLPLRLGAGVWAVALGAAALAGRGTLLWSNVAMVPLLFAYSFGAALFARWTGATLSIRPAFLPAVGPWITGATLYVAYNTVLAFAALAALAHRLKTPAEAVLAGIIGGLSLGLLCFLVTFAFLPLYARIWMSDLPLAAVFPAHHAFAKAYPLCLGAALWTTGAAILVALQPKLPHRSRWWCIMPIAFAYPVAQLGLGGLVQTVYPIMGYAGCPLLLLLILSAFRRLPRTQRPGV